MRRSSNTPPGVILVLAAAIAGLGQLLLGDPPQDSYTFTVQDPAVFALGLTLLLAGAIGFGWTVRKRREDPHLESPDYDTVEPAEADVPSLGAVPYRSWTAILGLALAAVSFIGMGVSGYEPVWGWIFVGAFLAMVLAFALKDREEGVRWQMPIRWWEPVFVALLMTTFVAINAGDLLHWYYSAIGDEYPFFEKAQRIAEGESFHPFSQAGVYGYHPELSSAYQSLVMRLFGVDYFGWKLSSVLAVTFALPFLYLLAMSLWGRRVAVIATVLMTASHFLFGYAHTGYNNVQALPVSLAAFWLFFSGVHRRSGLLLFCAGAFAGLCFYTIFTARITPVVLVIYTLMLCRARPPRWLLGPSLAGGLLTLVPFIVINGTEVASKMLQQSAGRDEVGTPTDMATSQALNTAIHIIAFNYNVQPHHYVTGSLMDPVSGVLAILGAGAILATLRDYRSKFVAVWWGVGIVSIGTLSPHEPYAVLSRLHYLVPCYAITAAIGLNDILNYISERVASRRLAVWAPTVATAAATTLILLATLSVNLHRFWVESPREAPVASEVAMFRALQSELCIETSGDPVVVSEQTEFRMKVVSSYRPYLPFRPKGHTTETVNTEAIDGSSCVIMMDMDETGYEHLIPALIESGRREYQVADYTERWQVTVYSSYERGEFHPSQVDEGWGNCHLCPLRDRFTQLTER